MYELVYYSIASPSIDKVDIENILEVSRSRNKKQNVTGCLIFHNDQFTQILEGEKEDVLEIYASIEKDNRHHLVTLLYQNHKEKRAFEGWSMGYVELSDQNISAIQRNSFIDKLTLMSDLAFKPTTAVKIFWQEVREIIGSKNTMSA